MQFIHKKRKMNKKQTIRLNESQFNIFVKKIIKESLFDLFAQKRYKDSTQIQYQIKSLQTKQELIDICYLFCDNFDGISPEWFYNYILGTGLNPDRTVLAIDNNERVVGACVVTDEDFPFEELSKKNIRLAIQLYRMKYKCISVLAVNQKYRGGKLNYELVTKVLGNLKQEGYDYAYIQVFHHLKTHDYWKRYGSVEVLDDGQVKHYVLPISENAKSLLAKLK